ncbi:MAG: DNA polymerase [Patescibacteria group bacterium]|mgnify:CR=1 FL=1
MAAKTKKELLVILDAHAILHRAFHALPSFTSPQGEPTGALYGFAAMLLKIIRELKPDYLAAAYDLAEPTFRHIAYEKYKAQRPKTDDELVGQFNRSRQLLDYFHIPVFELAGFEADDIIGAIAEKNKKEKNLEIVIASGDLDTLQLVQGEKIKVYTLRKGNEEAIYDEEEVVKRFGFKPELLPDFKGLKGDPSDNIPGVSGIGDKTATELICKFGRLENILQLAKENPEKLKSAGIKERIIEKLVSGEEEAVFSKTLASIRRDVPIDFDFNKARWQEFEREKLEKFFREIGFVSLIARLPGASAGEPNVSEKPDSKILKKLAIAAWLLDSRRADLSFQEILQITGAKNSGEAMVRLQEELNKLGLAKVFKEIELPLADVLDEMAKNGILIDISFLKELALKYGRHLEKLTDEIYGLAGEKFNVNSTRELRRVLFEKLKLAVKGIRKTGGGFASTKFSELLKLKDQHPIIAKILEYREEAKLKSTYLDVLPQLAGSDGRLRSTFLQTGTVTGRLSSREPNLQNIPIRTELGREIRRAFYAPKGRVILAADYSQIELRVAAILSGDQKMKDAFLAGKDIHTLAASEIFNVSLNEVMPEMRRRAKVINFGILYGMGSRSLSENLGVSQDEADLYIQEYFHDFAGVNEFIQKTISETREKGYAQTLFGRKRFLPEINSQIFPIRSEAERMAVNAVIQGTAADIMKLAMIGINELFKRDPELKDDVKIILQIHDELLFEADKKIVAAAAPKIKEIMEGVLKTDIPIKIELSSGPNWAELKELPQKSEPKGE